MHIDVSTGRMELEDILENCDFLFEGDNTLFVGPLAPHVQVKDILALIEKLEEDKMPLEIDLSYKAVEDGLLMILLKAMR